MFSTVFIGLGSNLGDREDLLNQALALLDNHDAVDVADVSSFIETEAVAKTPQPPFMNAAAKLQTILTPSELLHFTKEVESSLGRTSKGTYEPRSIDIDILFFNDDIVCDEELTIPHPLLHERDFVLTPLMELAPDFVHPILQQSVADLAMSIH